LFRVKVNREHEAELVELARSHGYRREELAQLIELSNPPAEGCRRAAHFLVWAEAEGEWVVGRFGGFVVLASLALAFVAVALTTLKA
jgi:hypothetical protein